MADLCFYEIHVKGTKKACYAYMVTTPMMENPEIFLEKGTDEDFVIHFASCCKWALDYYCEDEYDNEVNLDMFSLEEIKEEVDFLGLTFITPQLKSKILGVEVEICFYSEEDMYNREDESMYKGFYKYNNGEFIDVDEIEDIVDDGINEELIWDKDEYENFEEFLCAYDLENYNITENEFEHSANNVYIRPRQSSSYFTF